MTASSREFTVWVGLVEGEGEGEGEVRGAGGCESDPGGSGS